MAQSNPKRPTNQPLHVGVSHSRSLSQPSSLLTLSPNPPTESSLASPNSSLKDAPMDVVSRGPSLPPIFPKKNFFPDNSLPPRIEHRRSNSDVPLGFSNIVQSSPQFVPMISDHEIILGRTTNITERNQKPIGLERHERIKRCAVGDMAPTSHHYRTLSMDSGIGKFQLGDDESPKFQISMVNRADHISPRDSVTEYSTNLNLDLGYGEFNEYELKKIMTDQRLVEIAISDPKRTKRILANRQSAARSKERKLRYISELENKVKILHTEATTLSAEATILQKEYDELTNQNKELKIRIQAMEKHAQLRDALHEALSAEVQRLKLANMELKEDGRSSNGMPQ